MELTEEMINQDKKYYEHLSKQPKGILYTNVSLQYDFPELDAYSAELIYHRWCLNSAKIREQLHLE